ncbi:MAG: coproporphyrinogen III oxidase, partial [Pseudomonadota bacterium]
EISNHAVPGAESRHNLVYWRYGEYVGVGPGAHGRLIEGREPDNESRTATACERNPEAWLERVNRHGHGLVEDEPLDAGEAGDEMLVMGLRLREGLDVSRFEAITGMPLRANQIEALKDQGFVEWLGPTRVRVTPEGWPVLDAVVAELAA